MRSMPDWNLGGVSEDSVILYKARGISEIIHAKIEMQLHAERVKILFRSWTHGIRIPSSFKLQESLIC